MLQAGFYLLTIAVLVLIAILLRKANNPKRTFSLYFSFIGIWLIYVFFIGQSGILKNLSLPPKLPLLIVVPIIIGIIVITRNKSFKKILERNELHIPIYMQSFRILVELLIYFASRENILPMQATIEGTNYDMISGFSALVVAYLIQKDNGKTKILLYWNIAGLIILATTVFSFIYSYYFTDFLKLNPGFEFVQIPYLFLAAILMPAAVFLHLFSIKQALLRKKNI